MTSYTHTDKVQASEGIYGEVVSGEPWHSPRIREPGRTEAHAQPATFIVGVLIPRILLLGLFLLPIMFGAVHEPVYLTARALAFALLAAAIAFSWPEVFAALSSGRYTRSLCIGIGVILAYVVFQYVLFSIQSITHPVLGSTSRIVAPDAFFGAVGEFLFFATVFVLARTWLAMSESHARRMTTWLGLSALVTSLVALLHWFYDSGRLFWIFEPESVFVSDRARWPFVNSNHLAQFLIPIAFLLLARIVVELSSIKELVFAIHARNKRTVALLVGSRSLQQKIIRLALTVTILLAASLSIAGSLSRGGWLGSSVGLIVFLISMRVLATRREESAPLSSLAEKAPRTRVSFSFRRKRRGSEESRRQGLTSDAISRAFLLAERLAIPLVAITAIALILFFLQERGSELVQRRIEYGLLHSKDDMRWQLYSDTLPMIRDNFFFGVGLGGWSSVYPQYMNASLSGVNPVYLHSEPLQIISELGVTGGAIILGTILSLSFLALHAILASPLNLRRKVLGLGCGLLALAVACCLDFPFRIPAITFAVAILIALLAFYVDLAKSKEEKAQGA